jgi:ribosomal protein L18
MFEIVDKFHNLSMKSREARLRTAKQETARSVRELKKDRQMLERTEKDIMKQLRSQLKAGDLPKAQMLGKQMAQYRNLSDKNFERAIYLQTEAQVICF